LNRTASHTTLALATLVVALVAHAGGLEKPDHVDLIELEGATSRALLLVLLDEDRVNTRPAIKTLFKKVNNYLDFVNSGQLKDAAPNANMALPPKIVVYGPKDATSAEMQNLAGLKLAGQKAGVEVEVQPYRPGLKPRPVPIKPFKRATGA
jgi:hypothetical protein